MPPTKHHSLAERQTRSSSYGEKHTNPAQEFEIFFPAGLLLCFGILYYKWLHCIANVHFVTSSFLGRLSLIDCRFNLAKFNLKCKKTHILFFYISVLENAANVFMLHIFFLISSGYPCCSNRLKAQIYLF